MKKFILVAGLAFAAAAPVSAEEYYIVRGPDKECRVVETRPTESTILQVGPLAFKTRDDADRELKVVCREEAPQRAPDVVIEREVTRERY
jgi:hypothetical protein